MQLYKDVFLQHQNDRYAPKENLTHARLETPDLDGLFLVCPTEFGSMYYIINATWASPYDHVGNQFNFPHNQ